MDQWEARMTRRPDPAPRLELLETPWQLCSPSRRILGCGIYRTDTGIEVRVGYHVDDVLYSQLLPEIESAREKAAELRAAVVAKGGFTEA